MKELLDSLKALLTDSVPEIIDSLNAGASEDEIRQAEKVIGFELPDDVKALYKLHNGQSGHCGLFCGLPFLSLEEALQEWKNWNDVIEEGYSSLDANVISVPSGHIKEVYCSRYYFPISKDHGGNNIVIDLDPDENGKKGQVINSGRDEDMRYVIAGDIAAFLRFIISQFENNNVRVEKEEEYTNWYLKSPANSHFLDTLKELNLPFGVDQETPEQNDLSFEDWVESQETPWKDYLNEAFPSGASWEALRKVKSLNLLGREFTDIKPLEEFSGLRELILTGNPVSDLSPLKSLEDLKKLYLAKTPVKSIHELSALSNLTQLSLFDTRLSSLEGIGKLNKLRSLSIESTSVQDITELGKLRKLVELDLSNNEFTSFEPLSTLKSLKDLNLANTNIDDLNVLGELTRLESLKIYDTPVTDFKVLASLEKLNNITCSYDYFLKIKAVIKHEVNFGISGKMTEKQKAYWMNHNLGENDADLSGFAASDSQTEKPGFWNKLKKKWF